MPHPPIPRRPFPLRNHGIQPHTLTWSQMMFFLVCGPSNNSDLHQTTNDHRFLGKLAGPQVQINIGEKTFTISKAIICEKSSYFDAMFNGSFIESDKQATTMEEIEGVVSVPSFELFIRWLYTDRVPVHKGEPSEQLTDLICLARFGDMCNIERLRDPIGDQVQKIILNSPRLWGKDWQYNRHPDTNTFYILEEHITDAVCLPLGHPVRRLIIAACVEGYLRKRPFKFAELAETEAMFGSDLLQVVADVLEGMTYGKATIDFIDPITKRKLALFHRPGESKWRRRT